MYTVYKHTTPSGKVYIGITTQKPEQRWDYGNGYRENKHFYRAIRKYGWRNIEHKIVANGLTKEQACNLEIELIAEYDSTNPDKGYNHSIGGECSALGVHPSAETRRKISESNKRAYLNSERRRIPWNKGQKCVYHHSSETRRKMIESNKGKNAKAVICVETGMWYSSGTEAAKSIGVTQSAISNVVRGIKKTAGGYHWQYAD